ncbi:uncharacterized protein LOC128676398 [Plodia interpunctella]|uniref:uncharacterized protein LOC128676398 n=1 Tax=Plodia interpunctella TaxID=58824 RepID=UPI0031016D60
MARNEVAERIIDSLAFEVEASPQDNILEVSGTSKSTPLNLKIKVRKKDEALFQQGVVSVPKLGQPKKSPDKIRLVNSDQTVLSFKVFVDTDPEKKPAKKRKRFFGGCLSSEDYDDDDTYIESNNTTKPGEVAKLNFGLSKNVEDMQLQTRKPIMFFGNTCKPGGCLDPPYGEDRYSYGPKKCNVKIPTENRYSHGTTEYKDKIPTENIYSDETTENKDKTPTENKDSHESTEYNDKSPTKNDTEISYAITNDSMVESLDKTTKNCEPKTLTPIVVSGGISRTSNQKRSIQSIDVKLSFRDLGDLSHFSLVKDFVEKKRITQSENILEVPTPEDEMVITKLYPKDNDSSFQSETTSSTQGNEDNFATTTLEVEGATLILGAAAIQEIKRSKKENSNQEKESTTPINKNENKKNLRSGDDGQNASDIMVYPEKEVLNTPTVKSDDAFHNLDTNEYDEDFITVGETVKPINANKISKNAEPRDLQITPDLDKNREDENENYARDQKLQSREDNNIIQSEKYASRDNLSNSNEKLIKGGNDDTGNIIPEIKKTSDVTDDNISHDAFQTNDHVQNHVINEIMSKNNTEANGKSNDQPVDELAINLNSDNNENSPMLEDLNNTNDGIHIKTVENKFGTDEKKMLNSDENGELYDLEDLNKTRDVVNIKNVPHQFSTDDENILKNQQSELEKPEELTKTSDRDLNKQSDMDSIRDKSSKIDTHKADNINNLRQTQASNELTNPEIAKTSSSSGYDNMNLKVDFINDDTLVMDNDKNKLKDKDQAIDSIISSRDGSKFQVKKDFINMNLAFQSYTNDQNESVIKSLDSITDIKREPQDNVTIIKSQLRIDAPNMIKVPIDARNYMTLQVKASGQQISPQTSSRTTEGAASRGPKKPSSNVGSASTGSEKSPILEDLPFSVSKGSDHRGILTKVPSRGSQKNDVESFQNLLSTVYDHQLIPLHRLISDLKTDVDKLASEQLWLKENCRRIRKPAKLTHSSRKCGCSRKFN